MKTFEGFQETEFNHFCGINISEIYSILFIWSNMPFYSDYLDQNSKPGDPFLRMELSEVTREKLRGISKDQFYDILCENGLAPDPTDKGGWSIRLVDQDLITFFHVLENIDEYKNK